MCFIRNNQNFISFSLNIHIFPPQKIVYVSIGIRAKHIKGRHQEIVVRMLGETESHIVSSGWSNGYNQGNEIELQSLCLFLSSYEHYKPTMLGDEQCKLEDTKAIKALQDQKISASNNPGMQ